MWVIESPHHRACGSVPRRFNSVKCPSSIGRLDDGLARGNSALAPGPRGFTSVSQGKVPCWNWLPCSLPMDPAATGRSLPFGPSVRVWPHLLCPQLTSAVRSESLPRLSVHFRGTPLPRTHRRPPGVSSLSFGAQPLALRCWRLMDMDFVLSRPRVPPSRLPIPFLFVGSPLCSTLPSDPPSR